jgi:hypothetical protein
MFIKRLQGYFERGFFGQKDQAAHGSASSVNHELQGQIRFD